MGKGLLSLAFFILLILAVPAIRWFLIWILALVILGWVVIELDEYNRRKQGKRFWEE